MCCAGAATASCNLPELALEVAASPPVPLDVHVQLEVLGGIARRFPAGATPLTTAADEQNAPGSAVDLLCHGHWIEGAGSSVVALDGDVIVSARALLLQHLREHWRAALDPPAFEEVVLLAVVTFRPQSISAAK